MRDSAVYKLKKLGYCKLRYFGDGDVWLLRQRDDGEWEKVRAATERDQQFFEGLAHQSVDEVMREEGER